MARGLATPGVPTLLTGRNGRVSWQARWLNRFFRLTVKRPMRRRGISPAVVRALIRGLEWLPRQFGDFATVHCFLIGGVRCDVVYPLNPPPRERVVLYLHGGGFFAHLPHSYQQFARRLAESLGATVYVPAYRLAPEHRYPAASDDCLAVYQALLEDGCHPESIAIMGDSAGGNLALSILLRARDAGLPLPSCAMVLSPGADLCLQGASFSFNAEVDPFIPVDVLRQLVTQYADPQQLDWPYVSPVHGNYDGLPPLHIVVGSTEVLLDSSRKTAEAARAAGVPVELQVWRDMPHVFPMFASLPEARLAVRDMAAFFNLHVR